MRANRLKADGFPFLNLIHLRFLTDDTGILQHARFNVPQREHGYCTDDNARALIVSVLAQRLRPAAYLDILAVRYLSFLEHAFNEKSGRFRNFMTFDRRWLENQGSEDSHGRAVWALGLTAARTTSPALIDPVSYLFERAVPALLGFTALRAFAFGTIGLCFYLERFRESGEARGILEALARRLLDSFKTHASPDWPWPEELLTYSNAKIPQALILAGGLLGDTDLLETGLRSLAWLVELQIREAGHFVPIGNKGWCRRNGERARFDQQPVEAQAMTDACLTAYEATGESFWLDKAHLSFEWFLGRNDLASALYNASTGGCCDGLSADCVNQNQGAESTLSWLMSLCLMLSLDTDEKAAS